MGGCELRELHPPDLWCNVVPDVPPVVAVGRVPYRAFHGILEPPFQVLGNGQVLGVEADATVGLGDSLLELRHHLRLGAGVDAPSPDAGRGVDSVLGLPASVLALLVGSLTVRPAVPLRHCSPFSYTLHSPS